MNEIKEGIKRMGFDAEMAENLYEIVRITREAAIEECAMAIENYNPDRQWSADSDMQNQAYYTGGEVQSEIVDLVRALALPPSHGDTP
jgi:hypothetical protein